MVHMVHFFVFQGCLYFDPWDTLVLGHFVDTVSSMCTSVIHVSYMCTSATCMYLVLSRGVRGPCTKNLVLFYIEFSVSSDAAC